MSKEKLVTQIALFQTQSREKMEIAINGSLQEIATLGHTYKSLKTWSDLKGGTLYWHAILEYELTLETLVGKPTEDQLDNIKQLQKYRLNPNHSLNDIGLIGTQAFVVQNGLVSLTFKESYSDLKKTIWDLVQLDPNDPIGEFKVKTVEVDLNLGNGD
tara:strand:+ start:2237 stop:2710 length:474 start_codon:yes stop_codon:yes gene_type:complete